MCVEQSDVYALALVVFECISGLELGLQLVKQDLDVRKCFDFADFTSSGGRPLVEELVPQWGLSLCNAVTTAWAQEPRERETAEALASALQGSSKEN